MMHALKMASREKNVKNQVFVPLSDDILYDHPELIQGPIAAVDPTKVEIFKGYQSVQSARVDGINSHQTHSLSDISSFVS
jgi:hypothetical protein